MSKIKPNRHSVTLGGESYELHFNLNVMEVLQEAGFDILKSQNDTPDAPDTEAEEITGWEALTAFYHQFDKGSFKATKIMLTAMINEGIDIRNESLPAGEKKPHISEWQVGNLIQGGSAAMEIRSAIHKAVDDATPKKEEGIVAKNTQATAV